MYKGQRPSVHRRRVHTRRGVQSRMINPSIKKITHRQYLAVKKTKMNGDEDKDGVKNRKDCRPFDPRKQDDLPVYKIHGEEYYLDRRLREYRSTERPWVTLKYDDVSLSDLETQQ